MGGGEERVRCSVRREGVKVVRVQQEAIVLVRGLEDGRRGGGGGRQLRLARGRDRLLEMLLVLEMRVGEGIRR